jgi:uncharacterized protein
MNIDFINNLNVFSFEGIAILTIAGFLVGVINTIAGSGTIITYSLFMMLGLPANYANGTIRLGVIMQTLASSGTFWLKHKLDVKKGLMLAVPIILGTIIGARIAVNIDERFFEKIIGIVMIMMLIFIFLKPERWIEGKEHLVKKKTSAIQIIVFFLIGLYGGFIHIGVGIFLLAALVLLAGYDLVRANALKVFIVFLYSPFALTIFIMNGHVHYGMGLIAAIGNLIGGIVASKFAVDWGAKFIRWFLIIVIILFASKLLGVYSWF